VRPSIPPRPPAADIAVAAAAATALIVDGINRGHGAVPVAGCVMAILACAPLAWRRSAPLAVLCAVFCGVLACLPLLHPYDTAVFVVMIALYTVAEQGERRRSLVVGAASAVLLVGVVVLVDHREGVTGEAALRLVLALGALVVGDTVRARRDLAASARREQEAESRRRAEAERLMIARELHDTVAHALVAINVRAGVATVLADTEAMPDALTEIQHVSSEALSGLRATLGLLRSPDDDAPTGPDHDLANVTQLIERTTAAGIQTQADVDLRAGTVPSPIGQAGYRIVQESLTNVMRHSQARNARVIVRLTSAGLDIEITDDGRATEPAPRTPGHGLQGMSERAVALGGTLSAGPRRGGGWRVSAHLPVAPA
jgi:signal transduction histidine kinase